MFASIKSLLLVLALLLSGCAATVSRPGGEAQAPLAGTNRPSAVALLITGHAAMQQSADWHTFRAEWQNAFSAAASAAGLTSTYLETEPADQPPGTVVVKVAVNDYRYVTPGARFGFGIMTGNAFVDADAEFFEFPGQRSIGKRKYATSSTAWQGIFSAMTDKQLRAISDTMMQELLRR